MEGGAQHRDQWKPTVETSSKQRRREGSNPSQLRARGWLWRGRPLDFFALAIVVLATTGMVDLVAGTARYGVALVLVRSGTILLVTLIVAVLAFIRPEALSGRRAPRPPDRRDG